MSFGQQFPKKALAIILLPLLLVFSYVTIIVTSPSVANMYPNDTNNYLYMATVSDGTWSSPIQVATINLSEGLRDTYQRKVAYDGTNYFIWYFDNDTKKLQYISGNTTWGDWRTSSTFSAFPYYGGNFDWSFRLGSNTVLMGGYIGSNGQNSVMYPYTISGSTVSKSSGGSHAQGTYGHGGSICINPKGIGDFGEFYIYHSASFGIAAQSFKMDSTEFITTLSIDATHATGGAQILPYDLDTPYPMFVLAKNSTSSLQYNLVNAQSPDSWVNAAFTHIETLGTGFSDFCATSEANLNAIETVHFVYVNSTGSLFYRYYNGSLSEATYLANNVTYPVISVTEESVLYVNYVKSGAIMQRMFNSSWESETTVFGSDDIYSPSYLSSNQEEQNGENIIVWASLPAQIDTDIGGGITMYLPFAGIGLGIGILIIVMGFASRKVKMK